MAKQNRKEFVISFLRILLLVLVVLAMGYGLLLTFIGRGTQKELDAVKDQYASVTVMISELRHSAGLSGSMIVVLKPVDEEEGLPEQLGNTIATTSNKRVRIGDRLTMYYDPEDMQARVVDFQTAKPMQTAGLLLTGFAFLLLLLMLVIRLIRRKKQPRPTAIR